MSRLGTQGQGPSVNPLLALRTFSSQDASQSVVSIYDVQLAVCIVSFSGSGSLLFSPDSKVSNTKVKPSPSPCNF